MYIYMYLYIVYLIHMITQVAIRFKCTYNGVVIDDCFKTPNAYYYRVGNTCIL